MRTRTAVVAALTAALVLTTAAPAPADRSVSSAASDTASTLVET